MLSPTRLLSIALLAIFLVPSNGISIPSDCIALLSFAVSEKDLSDTVVLKSYQEILKEIGEDQLKPELIQKMIQAEDPYTIPSDVTLDSNSLATALTEFKRLLSERTGETVPYKTELLQFLRKRFLEQTNQNKAEEDKSKDTAKRKLLLLSPWQDPPRDIHYYNGWLVSVAGSKMDMTMGRWVDPSTIYLRNLDGRAVDIPYPSSIDVIATILNPSNGEIWFSDRGLTEGRPPGMNLMRMSLFDEQGNPRKEAIVSQFPSSKALDEYSVDDLAFSRSGTQLLILDDHKGGLLLDFKKGGALLGKVVSGGGDPHFGFINDQSLFVQRADSSIEIIDVRDPAHGITLNVEGYESVQMSPDGKTLYVPFRRVGKKQGAYVWDMALLKANPNLRPTILDFGHRNPEGNWQAAWGDELFALNGDVAIHIKRTGGQSYLAEEIRVIDVKDPKQPKLIETFPIPGSSNYLHEIKLTPDGKYIYASEGKDNRTLKTWIWDISRLLDP